jgi:NAD(P)-dependent dehydrogenase (short-subunit alcohol dehydrogenase family)
MAGKLSNRVVLVTGGSSGIGRAAAESCARDGARIAISDINAETGHETVESLQKEGAEAIFIQSDVSRSDEVEAMVAQAVSHFGRLDGAFNNAGVASSWAHTVRASEEDFDRTIAVNLKGVWLCLKHEIKQMLDQGSGGAIVNTSSVAGLVGARGGGGYVASKHGVVGLTKTASLEFSSKGVRVNAVCPGAIETPMMDQMLSETGLDRSVMISQEPIGRLGEPREIGDAVAWLLSKESSFVTGIAMPVDGGYTAI